MAVFSIKDLLHGEGGAEQLLVSQGMFPDDWLKKYESAIIDLRNRSDGPAWPKREFSLLHYASMHLGLRYQVWKKSLARPAIDSNARTESTISEIQFLTEVFFWSSVADLLSWESADGISDIEIQLINLCLGEESPIKEIESDDTYKNWQIDYDSCLGEVKAHYQGKDSWQKWTCIAIHFAAFYIDLFQARSLEDRGQLTCTPERSSRVEELVERLRLNIGNADVLELIELWLKSCHIQRDSSGLPVLGPHRPRTGQFVSVRTTSEIFIQTA